MWSWESFFTGVVVTISVLGIAAHFSESSVDSLCKKHFQGSIYSYDLEDCAIEVKK